MDCIFCKIVNGDIPSYTIYEDDLVKAFLDVNPEANGHTLLIPKNHYTNLCDIDIELLNHISIQEKEMMNMMIVYKNIYFFMFSFILKTNT